MIETDLVGVFLARNSIWPKRRYLRWDWKYILKILLPNTKPILVGIIYKPPDKADFLEKFAKSLDNTNNFNVNETYILGD